MGSSVSPFSRVRDYLPLQQGLRRAPTLASFVSSPVRDYLPLQQGLRPTGVLF